MTHAIPTPNMKGIYTFADLAKLIGTGVGTVHSKGVFKKS